MKTLIIRLSSLGDVLLATAVVRMVKAYDPTGVIDVCTRPAYDELFAANPHVREVVSYNDSDPSITIAELRRKEKYDTVIDLHNNIRSRAIRHNLEALMLVVKKRTFAKWLLVQTKINLLENAPDIIGRYVEALAPLKIVDDKGAPDFHPAIVGLPETLSNFLNKENNIIGICPGAKHFTKRWPAERYTSLCDELITTKNKRIILFGGEMDADICAQIHRDIQKKHGDQKIFNSCSMLSLSQVALTMDRCEKIITNDSGLMHLASARHRPIVAIFGSTVKEFGFVPRGNVTVVEVEGLSCRPCSHIGLAQCPKGHFRCMKEIGVERIADVVEATS